MVGAKVVKRVGEVVRIKDGEAVVGAGVVGIPVGGALLVLLSLVILFDAADMVGAIEILVDLTELFEGDSKVKFSRVGGGEISVTVGLFVGVCAETATDVTSSRVAV